MAEVEKLLKEDQVATAIAKIAKAGGTGSFIEPAVQAEKLVADIVAKGKDALASAEKKLAEENEAAKLDGALDLVAAVRVYGRLPELKKRGGAALAEQRKNPTTKELIRQAETFDAARDAETKAGGAARAATAYQKIVAQFPDTLIARVCRRSPRTTRSCRHWRGKTERKNHDERRRGMSADAKRPRTFCDSLSHSRRAIQIRRANTRRKSSIQRPILTWATKPRHCCRNSTKGVRRERQRDPQRSLNAAITGGYAQ